MSFVMGDITRSDRHRYDTGPVGDLYPSRVAAGSYTGHLTSQVVLNAVFR